MLKRSSVGSLPLKGGGQEGVGATPPRLPDCVYQYLRRRYSKECCRGSSSVSPCTVTVCEVSLLATTPSCPPPFSPFQGEGPPTHTARSGVLCEHRDGSNPHAIGIVRLLQPCSCASANAERVLIRDKATGALHAGIGAFNNRLVAHLERRDLEDSSYADEREVCRHHRSARCPVAGRDRKS